MPFQVFATPLFREHAEERGVEAEHEAGKPEHVDRRRARRGVKFGRVGEPVSGVVEERLLAGESSGLDSNEGKKFDGKLRIVGLNEDE